jgi:RNA polymerase sigma-70 factor (ECF subfamily)
MHEGRPDFWELIAEHRAELWRFTLALTRSRENAKDLISDTVVAAFRSYPKLRDATAFRKFLFTIATRIQRRQKWRQRIFTRAEEGMDHLFEGPSESEHDIEKLMSALNRLPEKQREALVLFELSGFSIEEIREIQGGSISGVKTRLSRGREAVRGMLTEFERVLIAA